MVTDLTNNLYPDHDRTSCSDHEPVNAQAAGSHGCARCTSILLEQGEQAVQHLQAILNSKHTATQSWQAEQEARQWLKSIGSEPA